MELTKKQEEGLKIAVERFHNNEKYTVIAGYAGTGKSTLVKFIIEALDVEPSKVAYATFTGKAAEVLRKKGNKNACTLHKLLYEHIPRPGGGFFRKPKSTIEYSIIVVDEISMVPVGMMQQLFKHKVYVICLGDPFQIPPIEKDQDNHLLDNPHIFLDEIMRQAADSEIIRLSIDIREMKPLELFKGKNVQVIDQKDYEAGMVLWADQIICGTNAAVEEINVYARNLLGRGPLPEDGDKILCRQNYWEDISDDHNALVNGTIGYLKNLKNRFIYFPYWIGASVPSVQAIQCDIETDEGDIYKDLYLDKTMLTHGARCLDNRDIYKIGKHRERVGDLVPKFFTYGYGITGHKAQGSEWDNVLVLEEPFPRVRLEHARWLYTAITRASEKVIVRRK